MTVEMLKDAWKEGMSLAAVLSGGQCRLQYYNDDPTHQPDGDLDEYFDEFESRGGDNINL